MKPHAMYVRKSGESDERQVLSIPAQVQVLRELAVRRGLTVAVVDVHEEAMSAKAPGRPVFNSLLQKIRAGRYAGLLCWKIDRLARNPVDGAAVVWELSEGRLKEIVSPEATYTATGNDKLMMQFQVAIATKFIDDLVANVKRGNRMLLGMGMVPGSVPLGYRKEREPRRLRGAGKVVPDGERFTLVERLWRMLLTGSHNVPEIQRAAAQMGLRTRETRRSPAIVPSVTGLYNLFGNPFYYGLIRHGGETFRGIHQPMITPEEFERAQRIIGRTPNRRRVRHLFTYQGLLRCASCRQAVVGENHINRFGTHYVYYRCSPRRPCERRDEVRYVSEPHLHRQVMSVLDGLRIPQPFLDWILKALPVWAERDERTAVARATQIREALVAREAELGRYTDLCARGLIPEAEYLENRRRLEPSLHRLRADLEDPSRAASAWVAHLRDALQVATPAAEVFRKGSNAARRALLGRLTSNLLLDGRNVATTLRFPYDVLFDFSSRTASAGRGTSNPGEVPEEVLNLARNRKPRGVRFREIQRWQTFLCVVRTQFLKRLR